MDSVVFICGNGIICEMTDKEAEKIMSSPKDYKSITADASTFKVPTDRTEANKAAGLPSRGVQLAVLRTGKAATRLMGKQQFEAKGDGGRGGGGGGPTVSL